MTSDLLAEISSPALLEQVVSWLDDLALIASARPQAPVVQLIADRRRVSVRTIYNKLDALEKHGPSGLLDGRARRKLTKAPEGHRSPAFVQHVHGLYYQVARNNATPSVQKLLLQQLRDWRRDPANPKLRIPGYAAPPVDSADSRYRHPFGWSLRNLNEIKPDSFQVAEGRLGRQHSNALLPPVLTTRVGLAPGQAYLFDDQYYDLEVHWGQELVRPVGLNVLDLASGCDVARGIRPELPNNPEGEKSLVRADTIWLVVHLLTVEGYHREKCQLILESGTSTIDQTFARHIGLVTDQRVTVNVGQVSKDIVRGVLLPSKGNPRFKAARESWFNLLRNRMGHLPLALGKDREHKPEDTDRLADEDGYLLAIAQHLPTSVASQLQLEGLPWSRFFQAAMNISEAINQRTDHDLEGWASCGHERVSYLYGGTWIGEGEYLSLPPAERGALVTRMRQGEVVSRLEKASPREVYESGRENLRRVSPWRWNLLIPHEHAIARTVPANRMLKIERRSLGPEPIHFQPYYLTEDREQHPMPAGADVLIFLSPISPDFALITRTDGRPYGLCFAIQKGTRFDEEALLAQYAVRNQLRADISGTAAVHNHHLAEVRTERREHNAAILEAAGIDPKKVAKVRRPAGPKKPAKKPRKTTPKTAPSLTEESEGTGLF